MERGVISSLVPSHLFGYLLSKFIGTRLMSIATSRARCMVPRVRFLSAYLPGLSLLVLVFIALTILRSARDDSGARL